MSKSNIIGICGAISYFVIFFGIGFVLPREYAWLLIPIGFALAFPFSVISFPFIYIIGPSGFPIIILIVHPIWWYFFARFIYAFIKAANSPRPDIDEGES